IGLWRGPALADLANEPVAQTAILRLEELRLLAVEERVDAELALGRHDRLVAGGRSLAAGHPHRARLWGRPLLALSPARRQAEALDAYRAGRRAMLDQLGIEPTPALQGLQAAILRQDAALDAPDLARPERPAPARRTLAAVAMHDRELAPLT